MKLIHWATALATTLLVTTQVYAGSLSDDYTDDSAPLLGNYQAGKVYFGGAMGYLSSTSQSGGLTCNTATCTDLAWKAYAGYQVTEKVAAELTYHNFGHYESQVTISGTTATTNSDPTGLSATAKISSGLFKQADVFGRAGFLAWNAATEASTSTTIDHSGTDLLIGVGADYKINENLMVRGEYERVGGDLNAHIFSLGANYKTF
ncbi:porin family protein [Thiofilum flexile]|uniref:porin family protein n=1 Tax=Thiofilum flexile TaxID=125627 RepID=UPI0003702297|nr:porin family protein [Thiofilum flexile]